MSLLDESVMRRMRALHARIDEFYSSEHYFDEIFRRCADAVEMWKDIRAIAEMADDIMADIDAVTRTGPERKGEGEPGAQVDGKSMGNAIRQQRYRERKKLTQSALSAASAPPKATAQLELGS